MGDRRFGWKLALGLGLSLFAVGLALQVAARRGRPSRSPEDLAALDRALEQELARLERLAETDGAEAARALPPLRELASRTRDPSCLRQVFRALERIGGPESVLLLRDLARAHPDLLADAAVRISRIRGRDAAPGLIEVLEGESGAGPLAAAAVRALGETRLRSLIPRLAGIIRDGGDPLVKVAAVEALGAIADPDAVPVLASVLRDPEGRVRREALRSLGRIRSPASVEALERHLAAPASERSAAEEELAKDALARLRGEAPRSPW